MRTIPVCFSLAVLIALTQGVSAEGAGKSKGGGLDPLIKPIETVATAPIKIIQGVMSPVTKPKG